MSFKPIRNNSKAQNACLKSLHKCVRDIQIWINLNTLELNGDKSEFIMFGMKQQLAKINTIDINISGTPIQTVESVSNLSYFMDCFMKNPNHTSKASGHLYGLLKDVRFIHLQINQDTAKILVQALVLSKLDYCNSLLSDSAQYEFGKLQGVQNKACRVVFNLRKYDHVTAQMRNLHWLRICKCITYKLAPLMFKINKKEAPKYLCDLVTSNSAAKHKIKSAALVLSSQFSAFPHYL